METSSFNFQASGKRQRKLQASSFKLQGNTKGNFKFRDSSFREAPGENLKTRTERGCVRGAPAAARGSCCARGNVGCAAAGAPRTQPRSGKWSQVATIPTDTGRLGTCPTGLPILELGTWNFPQAWPLKIEDLVGRL